MARIGHGAHLAIYRVVPEAPARSGDTVATRDAAAIGPASATTTADGAFALLTGLIAAETGHAPHQIARTSTLDELEPIRSARSGFAANCRGGSG